LNKAFGLVLRNYRKAEKITQERLSERADVDVKMIQRVESSVRNPTLNLADSLAHGLGVPLWRLIKETEPFGQKHSQKKKKERETKPVAKQLFSATIFWPRAWLVRANHPPAVFPR